MPKWNIYIYYVNSMAASKSIKETIRHNSGLQFVIIFSIVIGLLLCCCFIVGLTSDTPTETENSKDGEEKQDTTADKEVNTAEDNQKADEEEEEPKKEISYEILGTWTPASGGEGKYILISKDYFNEEDMISLGEKLKNEVKNVENAYFSVFIDRKAWELRDEVVLGDNPTEADMDFYDKNHVGEYVKNANTGMHQFTIYFDGVLGSNQKTIKY